MIASRDLAGFVGHCICRILDNFARALPREMAEPARETRYEYGVLMTLGSLLRKTRDESQKRKKKRNRRKEGKKRKEKVREGRRGGGGARRKWRKKRCVVRLFRNGCILCNELCNRQIGNSDVTDITDTAGRFVKTNILA